MTPRSIVATLAAGDKMTKDKQTINNSTAAFTPHSKWTVGTDTKQSVVMVVSFNLYKHSDENKLQKFKCLTSGMKIHFVSIFISPVFIASIVFRISLLFRSTFNI